MASERRFGMGKTEKVYIVIMAGGGGTRFWPWSREKRPKQILPILSDRPMIWETVERVRPFAPAEKIFIVTARSQAKELHRQVPQIPPGNILMEPQGKNTAPCLCLAAVHIQKRDPEAVMVALPADHFIGNQRGFLRTLKAGARFAADQDFLITLGVRPTEPETGFGYIQEGTLLGKDGGIQIFKAKAFREKPAQKKAVAYLRRGDYFWNSGIFIWRITVFWEAMKKFLPAVYQAMMTFQPSLGTGRERRVLERVYSGIQPISVDYGIMERADNVAVMEAQFSWNDVGSWGALGKLWQRDKKGNALNKENKKILLIDSSGCLIRGEEKLIAVIGLQDLIVVEAGNALLVCPKERSQEVRRILEELRKKGWTEYL